MTYVWFTRFQKSTFLRDVSTPWDPGDLDQKGGLLITLDNIGKGEISMPK